MCARARLRAAHGGMPGFGRMPKMTEQQSRSTKSVALIEHLARFPEDLRDIRRLQRRYALSASEVAVALETLRRVVDPARPSETLPH